MALLSPGFHKWLSKRGLHPDTITVLQKESILQESTLKLLTDSDLDSIRKTHRITTGQFVLLRSAHSDLLEVDKDGFELVEMEDLPVQPKGASGQGQGSPTKKTGYKYRVKEKGQSTKGLMSKNLAKVAYRESKLQNAADTSEMMASSADELSRLSTLLAEKKRQEAGLRSRKHRYKRSTSSSSSIEPLTESKSSSTAARNNHDSSPPKRSRRHHTYHTDEVDTNYPAVNKKHNQLASSHEDDSSDDELDDNSQCCIIL